MASQATVINPWHWLNEDGSFPEHDARLRNKIIRVAQCIEYGGPLARGETRETLLACRRRPGNTPCPGLLWVLKQVDDAILAFCPCCKNDESLIYEWEETTWAEGPMEPVHVDMLASERGDPPPPPKTPGPGDLDALLTRTLKLLGSPMTSTELRRLVSTSPHPNMVIQAVLGALPMPPTRGALERFVPLLLQLWNQTPRADLGGRAPANVATAAPPRTRQKVGRNAPCPCGSGKKYKRCCGLAPELH